MKYSTLALFAVLLCTTPAVAQNYIGLSGGVMSYEDEPLADLDSQGFTLFAGGQFDPLISVEFAFTTLSNAKVSDQAYKASTMSLSAVLRSPGEGFEPFLRLGLARGDAKFDAADEANSYDENNDGLIFGLGADFALNYNSSLRLEYAETDLDGATTTRFSFGTIYRF